VYDRWKFLILLFFSFSSDSNDVQRNENEFFLLKKKISSLEDENYQLKSETEALKQETSELERKEKALIESCVREIGKNISNF
jgi:cell division protein FtsB